MLQCEPHRPRHEALAWNWNDRVRGTSATLAVLNPVRQ